MECNEKNVEPVEPASLLWQQVVDQSALCDVTIKVGEWEKRFHWCVLVVSPFFNSMYEDNFLEKSTGSVELHGWDEADIFTALSFLYGQTPNISNENLDTLLELSDFLWIPNLKAACIRFFKTTRITPQNCIYLLQWADRNNFEWVECDRFVRGKLKELMQGNELLTININQLKSFLADDTLTYIPVEDWYNFILRWVKEKPDRLTSFADLFNMLDFYGCDPDFLKHTVMQEPLIKNAGTEVEDTLSTGFDETVDMSLVCVKISDYAIVCLLHAFPTDGNDESEHDEREPNKYMLLNLRTLSWKRLDLTMLGASSRYSGILFGVRRKMRFTDTPTKNNSCFYKFDESSLPEFVRFYDIRTMETSTSNTIWNGWVNVNRDGNISGSRVCNCASAFDTLVAVTTRQTNTDIIRCGPFVDMLDHFTTLHVGDLKFPHTEMKAVISFKDKLFSHVCIDNRRTVAMLTENRRDMYLFDCSSYTLKRIELRTHEWFYRGKIQLKALNSGFVLCFESGIAIIMHSWKPSMQVQYEVKQISWKVDSSVSYSATEGLLVRQHRHKVDILEYVKYNELLAVSNVDQLHWHKIRMPRSKRIPNTSYEFQITGVPKRGQHCDIACPHCELATLESGKNHLLPDGVGMELDSCSTEIYLDLPEQTNGQIQNVQAVLSPDTDDVVVVQDPMDVIVIDSNSDSD